MLWAVVILLAGAAFILYRHGEKVAQAKTGRTAQSPSIRVVAAQAHKGNIDVYVNGLGTVVPIYTITVTSRVDGQLLRVEYREGQIVHEGDRLVEIDPRPYQAQLTQFEGALNRDQALLENARVDVERYRALLPQHAVPEQTFATQQSLVRQYEANVKSDQGQIESTKLNISYCLITSPITGRVGLRLVDPGNIVSANSTSLVVITQISPISVVFTVAEDQLPAVRRKLTSGAHLLVDAYDRAQKDRLARGSLETVDNLIDPTTGTVRLRALFDNANDSLYANQFVNARLLLEEHRHVTLVPNAAIQRNGSATYLWVVQPDHSVKNQPVKIGTTGPEESEILSGVAPGAIVVTEGVDRLHDGLKVNAEISGANPMPPAGGPA